MSDAAASGGPRSNAALLATHELLSRAKAGDGRARDLLVARYLPRLTRWASGRLPVSARSLLDTTDLVHDALLKTIQGLDGVEVRGPGGFQAYVRQAVLNRMRDQIRWKARRPGSGEVPDDLLDTAPSPLEQAIGADVLARYERGLSQLGEDDRELLHLRLELDFEYEEIAVLLGRPSKDAVRMSVQRALARLAEAMGHERT